MQHTPTKKRADFFFLVVAKLAPGWMPSIKSILAPFSVSKTGITDGKGQSSVTTKVGHH